MTLTALPVVMAFSVIWKDAPVVVAASVNADGSVSEVLESTAVNVDEDVVPVFVYKTPESVA